MMADRLAPFYRNGSTRELTATDYANSACLTVPQASGIMVRLYQDGILQREMRHSIAVYWVRDRT